jgi:hypothetical protein
MMARETEDRSTAAAFLADCFDTEIRAWRGKEPLGKVFWGYGVAISSLLAILYGAALYAGRAGVQEFLLLCFACYSVWVLVSIWRCVENTRQAIWGVLARQLTVIWTGNVLMLLLFLEIDVIARLFRG